MRAALFVLAALALLAGCLSIGDEADVDSQTQATDPAEAGWANRTLYLHGEDELAAREPTGEPEGVAFGSFYTAWANGEQQPTWTGQPVEEALLVDAVELTFFYTAESVVATTGPQGEGFPEFVVYLGTEQAPMAWASVEGPDVVQQGEQVEVQAELSLPAGGLVLPAGAEPIVKLAPVQGQGSLDGTRVEFLVNGTDTPSRAELVARPLALAEGAERPLLEETGTLAGSAYALGADEATTADAYEVPVDEATTGLDARLERVQGAGIADIDLELLDSEGEVVARSVTPEATEGLALREPNVAAIGEGPWTLRVVNYGNAAVEYSLEASVLEASGAS